ncbi:MAG: DUF2029 domain-containing protein [Acidobacteria bacterium]|nr:DUF2029 domain-containing protein [Acidobacteriota bacterium]
MKKVPLSTWALVILVSALWAGAGSLVIDSARKHDFLNLYTGGWLAREARFADMHLPEVQLEYERRLVRDTKPVVPFVRPHFYSLFLAPLSWFHYRTAFALWLVFQTLVLAGCWYTGYRWFGHEALVFAALFLPTALGIAHGQDCALMLAVSLAAYSFARDSRWFRSGAVLALGFAKFHLFLLWPLAAIATRRWRFLAGMGAGAAAEAIVSLALGGWTGAGRYIALLRKKDLERLSPSPEIMLNIQGISANFFNDALIPTALLSAAALLLWWIAIRNAPLWLWWTATAVTGLLIVPHVYGYDAGLLLLPLWLAIFSTTDKPVRIAAVLLTTPIPYLMNLADKPLTAVSALSLYAFLIVLAARAPRAPLTVAP